jgi:UDP:flavonoid glycosyltransferase YjiC (YdhE family)
LPDKAQFDKLKQKPLVLFSPLDWGYGHTTRSIPLINALVELNCSVIIACNNWQSNLLKPLFPSCTFIELQGYGIKYGKTKKGTRFLLILQISRILKQVKEENRWLRELLKTRTIHGILSDNRYGLYNSTIPAVLITHQLRIQSGWGRLADNILQTLHYRFIRQFSQCWVPDNHNLPGAAGNLSHPLELPSIPTRYLGCLTRFEPCTSDSGSFLLILLSGPEPQRSILEAILLQQAGGIHESVVLVRGTQSNPDLVNQPANVTIINYASTTDLNGLICNARLVIARSGYTTIMDLLQLKKKSILIPTPGQTEQEYLGGHLMDQQWAIAVKQKEFSLVNALKKAETFPFKTVEWDMEKYKGVVENWVETLL